MPLKVMYLDDEPDLCDIFSDEFSTDEIIIVTFTDANNAIEASKRSPPDVIFVDYRLPGTSGDLVALEMPAAIPKYLMTGEVTVATKYKFNCVFGKPYDREGIREILISLLAWQRAK